MYESKVSTVKSEWDNFSVMRNSNIKSPAFIPVPCPTHSDYSITNICKSAGCIEPLCPQCITAHVQLHQQTRKPAKIQNIINTRMSCIEKLGQIYEQLNQEYQKYEKSCGSNLESFLQKNRKKVELARNKIVSFVENHFAQLQEKLQMLEIAYLNQRDKKSKEIKSKSAPLLTHIEEISQYKAELESQDYIPALIELLNDPPKRPPTLSKVLFQEYGEVKIDQYAFEQFKTSVQSFISVQSLLPEQNKFTEQISKNNSKFSNQVKFSRLGRSSSREMIESQLENSRSQANLNRSNSRKKIFSNQKKGDDYNQVYNSTVMRSSSIEKIPQPGKVSITFETSFQQVTLIDRNYFLYDKGVLVYFPENQSYFYAAEALCADRGFQRFELPQNFVIPYDHQCIVTPDSRVFLFGGRIGNRAQTQCYEIRLKQISKGASSVKNLSPMKQARARFGAAYHNNFIYAFGGKKDGSNQQFISSCQRYNIQTDRWQNLKNMPQAIMSMNVCVFNDKIVKFGGIQQNGQILNRMDIFYPQSNQWSKFSSQIPFFIKMGSCQLNQTEMMIFGGQTQFNSRKSECFILRQVKRNEFRLYPCTTTLYNEGSFESSFVYKGSLLTIQNGENNKNKIIMKLECGKWRFLSC